MRPGPLGGLRVLELGGVGPVPHAGMMLGDLGADVLRIERDSGDGRPTNLADHLLRSQRLVALNLKDPADRAAVLELVENADVVLEGFRPGVAERLGLGPQPCVERNERLIYGRITGWGRSGPLAAAAGHDINYIALNGALHALGDDREPPVPPVNLAADFGGGSMLLVCGVLAALWERDRSGRGQVVDAAMVDGSSLLMQSIWAWRATGAWTDDRGANIVDGAAPFYRCYACADGKFVAVGAVEPQFYAQLVDGLGLTAETLPEQLDRSGWPHLAARFAERFAEASRDRWIERFADRDACVTPVMNFREAIAHPHAVARDAFVRIDGVDQPAPAPRFARTPLGAPAAPSVVDRLDSMVRAWKTAVEPESSSS